MKLEKEEYNANCEQTLMVQLTAQLTITLYQVNRIKFHHTMTDFKAFRWALFTTVTGTKEN